VLWETSTCGFPRNATQDPGQGLQAARCPGAYCLLCLWYHLVPLCREVDGGAERSSEASAAGTAYLQDLLQDREEAGTAGSRSPARDRGGFPPGTLEGVHRSLLGLRA